MGLFGNSKPKVSQTEFKEVCSRLYARGFSEHEVAEVKKIFRGDLDESADTQQGIDREEIDSAIKWMKENMDSHGLSINKIAVIEEELKEKL